MPGVDVGSSVSMLRQAVLDPYERSPFSASLEAHGRKILIALREGGKRILGRIVLQEIVLNAGLVGVREDPLPIDDAGTWRGHILFFQFVGVERGDLVRSKVRHRSKVLDMDHREAAGVALEILERVLAGNADPAQVHFHHDQVGVGRGEQVIVRQLAAEAGVRAELPPMVVVAKLDAGLFAGFARFVESFDDVLPTVGGFAFLLIDVRADDIRVSDGLRGVNGFRPFILNDVKADVAGRSGKAVAIQDRPHLFRRMIEVAGEFHFLVADRSNFGDGAREVRLHGIANGVKLDADFSDLMGFGE